MQSLWQRWKVSSEFCQYLVHTFLFIGIFLVVIGWKIHYDARQFACSRSLMVDFLLLLLLVRREGASVFCALILGKYRGKKCIPATFAGRLTP